MKCTLSDYTGALEDAQVAVSLGPASPYSYLQRAIALRALNRQDQALDDYEAALRLAPKDWPFRGPVEAILRNAGRR